MTEGEHYVFKISPLCWFLDETGDRVSNDRLHRFIVKSEVYQGENKKPTRKLKNKQSNKKVKKLSDDKDLSEIDDVESDEDELTKMKISPFRIHGFN